MSGFLKRVNNLKQANVNLNGITRGLEKESLRVYPDGKLAQTPHPQKLGSALTHPEITTDFSEALLEFITPPLQDVSEVLSHLTNIHRYTYSALDSELLWVNSMPCVLGTDETIPVAQYGSSNVAAMKTYYRVGLGHRYGRSMQTIAGIHYNFSLPDQFWEVLKEHEGGRLSLQDFKTQRYFDLIRNFRRYFWLLLYLFGAAPAVCKTFVEGKQHNLVAFNGDQTTLHSPFATSLRMGDLGYQSAAQKSLLVDYNNLPTYLKTLCDAITRPHADYQAIGVRDEQGGYRQLNTGVLQIENEFYSAIRPKRTANSGETALRALFDRGVEYIEVRCIDLNPYEPIGITAEQIHFIDSFLLFCALSDSPDASQEELSRIQENQQRMVYHGRDPKLMLVEAGVERPFVEWANELLGKIAVAAELLDNCTGAAHHLSAVSHQREKINQPELTLSGKVLADMQGNGQSFFQFAMDKAQQHADYFATPLSPAINSSYQRLAEKSLQQRARVEREDKLSFENYLKQFYEQYRCCAESQSA